jgi:Flp pilus assembly pilin Flp
MFKKLFKAMPYIYYSVPFPFFRKSEKGQGSAEFGTILAGLIVAVLIVIAIFHDSLISRFQRIASLMGGG